MKTTNTTPGWGNYKQARNYSGMSIRLLQDFVSSKLIRSSVVMKPGARRGVRLIDLRSLEKFIAAGVGKTSDIAMNATPATTGAANNSKGGQK